MSKKKITNSKIALLGNASGNFYNLLKFFRRQGIEADLILFNNELFLPSDEDTTPFFVENTIQTNWGDLDSYFHISKKELNKTLSKYDFFIVSGLGGIFLDKIGIKKNMLFRHYGADIRTFPYPIRYLINYAGKKSILRADRFIRAALAQRRVLKNCSGIGFYPKVKSAWQTLTNFKIEKSFLPLPLYMDISSIHSKVQQSDHQLVTLVQKLKKEHDFLILCPTRHLHLRWKHRDQYKGIDSFIEGYAKFIHETKNVNPVLLFFEQGHKGGVEFSQKMIKELNIEKNVAWIPRIKRNEVFQLYEHCDIVADQFHVGTYGSIFIEASLFKKPTLIHLNDEIFDKNAPPHFECKNSHEVSLRLKEINANKSLLQKTGEAAYNFVYDLHCEPCGHKYIEAIEKSLSEQD